jgi:hypothetical protein
VARAAAYRTGVRAIAVAVLLAAAARPGLAAPPVDVDQRRAEVAKALVRLGAELRRQILAGDVDALLARVPPEGLRCGDRLVPRAKVARDLRGSGTWLHTVFFGAPGAPSSPRAPASLAAFLASDHDVAIVVTFRPDARAGPVGRPCIDYRAKDVVTPGAPLCFEERGGRWWFTESLYPCG